jgi:uncharacterized protein (TIGR03085 family)
MSAETDRAVNHWARAERAALSDLLLAVGPDAPTLCDGWRTRDLAAHLVIREGRIDAAMGITIPAFAGWTKKVQDKKAQLDWPTLVDAVRNGPPKTSMMRAAKVDGVANTIEFYVHHEDVRRGQPDWQPRALDPAFEDDLWQRLQAFAPRLMKKAPVGVLLKTPDGRSLQVAEGGEVATVTGSPGELTLYAYGRQANVTIEGSQAARDALSSASFGI